ncbi:MAG: outer membrane protein assembly factor BamC, partial [Gammaproteobacteria bacterium]
MLAALGACSLNDKIAEYTRIDYKSAGKVPSLDIPPDLASPRGDGRYTVPARPGSETDRTASAFERNRATVQPSGAATVLPKVEGVRMERSGNERWLVTGLTPEQLWPLLREFWQESGFLIQVDSPQTGIMETDWAENRAKIPLDIIRRTLGKALDSLYSTGERDKFRTRVERSPEGTEIYISHRGMVEVYSNSDKDQTVWQPRPSDPELEIEFLRRLMVKLGASQERSEEAVAAQTTAGAPPLARLITEGAEPRLELTDGFDRAWRQVGLALDRGGFTVDDRDRSRGIYFVRYIDPEAQARQKSSKPGFFGRIFGGHKEEQVSQQFRLQLSGAGAGSGAATGTTVSVLDPQGNPVSGIDRTTATKILT